MPQGPSVHLVHCVICDDVRTEILSKETIVGIYGAGILVPAIPWAAMLCLWLTVIWSGDGETPIEIRVLDPRHAQVGDQKGLGRAIHQGLESTITFRNLFFTVEMEGIYTFQWRTKNGEWETVRQLPVYVYREQPTAS
jgi:hypothetical protein